MFLPKKIYVFCFLFSVLITGAAGAACNRNNLVRCLDSACLKNAANPSERCALCGTPLAADRASQSSGANLTGFNTASRNKPAYVLSDSELENSPDAPDLRYVWATTECIKKNNDCTAADVSRSYDSLIEQSCKFVLSDQEYSAIIAKQNETKSKSVCEVDLKNCMLQNNKCGENYKSCSDEATLSRFYSECVISEDCGNFSRDISNELFASVKEVRDTIMAAQDQALENLVTKYSNARISKIQTARDVCQPGGNLIYVNEYCKIMPNSKISGTSCEFTSDDERRLAETLAEFIDVACAKID